MKSLPFPLAESPDAEAQEMGRRLFAGGGAEFLKGVVAMSGLPPPLPPTTFATWLIISPALIFLVRSFDTIAKRAALP